MSAHQETYILYIKVDFYVLYYIAYVLLNKVLLFSVLMRSPSERDNALHDECTKLVLTEAATARRTK